MVTLARPRAVAQADAVQLRRGRAPRSTVGAGAPGQHMVGWIVLALLATTLHLAIPASRALPIAVVLALSAVQVTTLRRATCEQVPFAAIPVVVLNVVGTFGYLFYASVSGRAAVSATLHTDAHTYSTAAQIFATASVCTWLGALAVARKTGRRELDLDLIPRGLATVSRPALLLVALSFLTLAVVGRGPEAMLERGAYLDSTGPAILAKLSQLLLPIGLTLAAFVMFDRSKDAIRLAAGAVAIAYFLVYFSFATRGVALAPAVMVCAAFTAGRQPGRRAILMAVGATWILLQVPLALRSASGNAGLLPYVSRVLEDPRATLAADPSAILGNILYSVPLTGFVAGLRQVSATDVLAGANPLPSQFTDWNETRLDFRVNAYTPFSGLGELGSVGLPCVAVFFLLVGSALCVMQKALRPVNDLRAGIGFLAGVGLSLLFSVNLLQYNLRLSMRLMWCLVAIVVALRLYPHRAGVRADRRNTSAHIQRDKNRC